MNPQIDELTKKINLLEEKAAEFNTESFDLRLKRENLIAQMILDEKLLHNTNWELMIDNGKFESTFSLEYKDPLTAGPMKALTDLAKSDYDSWFELSDGIRIQFDSECVSLVFKESKQLMPFVKKNKLLITGTGITDRLAKLKREISALEDICHTFNL